MQVFHESLVGDWLISSQGDILVVHMKICGIEDSEIPATLHREDVINNSVHLTKNRERDSMSLVATDISIEKAFVGRI